MPPTSRRATPRGGWPARTACSRRSTQNKLDALIAPSLSPAWPTDHVLGDHFVGAGYGMAAVAGTPSITVPIGDSHGLPLGLTFMGRAYSEGELIGFGFALEQATKARRAPQYSRRRPASLSDAIIRERDHRAFRRRRNGQRKNGRRIRIDIAMPCGICSGSTAVAAAARRGVFGSATVCEIASATASPPAARPPLRRNSSDTRHAISSIISDVISG